MFNNNNTIRQEEANSPVFSRKRRKKMRTITSDFTVKGRWTQYPGEEMIVNKIKAGENPILKLTRDDEGQIILVNPVTNETAGCIPPAPAYEDNYDLLECFLDLGLTMDAIAIKVSKKKHYRVRVSAYVKE
jgi:hypothetical protein